ncbi:protein regulator of cytokinesis 1-like [Dermacentor silvarum]|uniref:protein regulator of cytokinesis 1-like n=1 Tax=Dermacentor silvarum TaxID=543639 RepID=UPI0021017452|nr:protein regulator of cytokinesis 1-like [Dermacentor silvarum]
MANKATTSEICDVVGEQVRALVELWHDVGIDGEAMRSNVGRTKRHVVNLFTAMRDDLEEMKGRILRHISSYTSEVEHLASELAIPVTLPEGRTVAQQEDEMRALVERLREMRSSRKRELRRLRSEEADLCCKLEEPEYAFGNEGSLPSQEELNELRERLHALKHEKALRTYKFWALQREVVAQLHLVGAVPDTQFKRQIVDSPETFIMSLENLEKAAAYLQKLKELAKARHDEITALMEELTILWDRLDVPEEQQLGQPTGLTAEVINTLKVEMTRLKDLKRQNMQKFVQRTHDELLRWRQKCCIAQMLEEPYDPEDVSQEHLEKIEDELKILKDLHSENRTIFAKVDRREALWTKFLELEKKSNDCSRFNRKAKKECSRLQAVLRKLEQDIHSHIKNYRGSKQEDFNRWGDKFLGHIAAQNEAYSLQKEQEQLERLHSLFYVKQGPLMRGRLVGG